MPEMNLRWPQAAGFNFLWLQILGYIGWPHDEAEREARAAHYFAEQLGQLGTRNQTKSRAEQNPDLIKTDIIEADRRFYDPARRLCFEALEEFGWFQTLLSASGNSRFPLVEVVTAGRVLLIIRSIEAHHPEIRGGGSVKKAAFLLESHRWDDGLTLRNERDIKRVWGRFKNSSHLTASLLLSKISRADSVTEMVELLKFLIIAQDFQRFGTTFCPRGRSSPPYLTLMRYGVCRNSPIYLVYCYETSVLVYGKKLRQSRTFQGYRGTGWCIPFVRTIWPHSRTIACKTPEWGRKNPPTRLPARC